LVRKHFATRYLPGSDVITYVAIRIVFQFENLPNVYPSLHLNPDPAILIATPVIELKPDETLALPIELTYLTAATSIVGSER
jgi:hypothetical protein